MSKGFLVFFISLTCSAAVFAQTGQGGGAGVQGKAGGNGPSAQPDVLEFIRANNELMPVFNLGRWFSFVYTVEKARTDLRLSGEQLKVFSEKMRDIKKTERLDPDAVYRTHLLLEDTLTVDQLRAVELLAGEYYTAYLQQQPTKPGMGGPRQKMISWIKGGPFNILSDPGISMGKDFLDFFAYIENTLADR